MKLKKILLSLSLMLSLAIPVVGVATTTTVNADVYDPGYTYYGRSVIHVSDMVTQKSFVPMVSFNSDNTVSRVTNRALQNDTPWLCDMQRRGADGDWYYRVSTNEWVGSNYVASSEMLN